jgi:CMP-2-keto-3-deoxyoctulosonic acid synthetase
MIKNRKVKVTRDDVTVQVQGGWPFLKVKVVDKVAKASYHTHYTVYDTEALESTEYRTAVAEQFIDRALAQRK